MHNRSKGPATPRRGQLDIVEAIFDGLWLYMHNIIIYVIWVASIWRKLGHQSAQYVEVEGPTNQRWGQLDIMETIFDGLWL